MSMPVTVPSLPQQVAPPGEYGERVFVDTTVRVDNEQGSISVTVSYEVQENHAAAGYRVVQGGSRVEDLQVGTHVLRHWFVLDGPPEPPARLNVVDMRVRAQAGNQSRRGFAALMQ
ncbi:MAG: hypothetical protein QOH06_5333 [Acidobacteriota bacterium]|jgi:hypothetical protein|nr:hypothetical protein [Acidobacteriota bacterium]